MLLLTPGLAQTTRVWEDVWALAGAGCQVVTWDLPGLGCSDPRLDGDYSPAALARDLRAVLEAQKDQMGPDGVILVGQSLSPMLILDFCRLYPDQLGHPVAGLVLVCGTDSPPLTTMAHGDFWSRLRRPLIEPTLRGIAAIGPALNLLAPVCYHNGSVIVNTHAVAFAGREPRAGLDRLARMISRNSYREIARMALACLDFDARPYLPDIPIPALLLAGEGDYTVLPTASERMARRLPHARLEVWPAARHVPCLEYPARFNQLLLDFLTEIQDTRASTSPRLTATSD
jgi:pimeloyl-ACP methyl ester carboxylesterase